MKVVSSNLIHSNTCCKTRGMATIKPTKATALVKLHHHGCVHVVHSDSTKKAVLYSAIIGIAVCLYTV